MAHEAKKGKTFEKEEKGRSGIKKQPTNREIDVSKGRPAMRVIGFGSRIFFGVSVLLFISASGDAFGHCDGMDGPVVKAAQKALETGDANPVLIWVQKKDEAEIKKAFQKTLAVRKLSPQAKELADIYFFETLVRVHRAGEGEPYTGLKPAGRDLGPAIPTADKALESGKIEPLVKLLTESMQTEVREKFKQALAKKKYRPDDADAGRAYVEAYVPFVRYVEQIYEAMKTPSDGHLPHVEREAAHR